MENPNPKISEETTTPEKVGLIDDLLAEIFAHLPTKPLIRFKLLSKHWNSIISQHNNRVVGLIFRSYQDTRVVSYFSSNPLPQIVLPHHLKIFHSCNGRLVLKNTVSKKYEYYLYNPTASSNEKTPTPLLIKDEKTEAARERDWVCGMYLAFDPSKSPYYKVVCVWELDWLTNNKKTHQYQFEVYSSETGSWETRGVWSAGGYVGFDNGVFWNGAIHWVGSVAENNIYFNPEHDEVPRVMPAPSPARAGRSSFYFGESCGHLHCCADQHVDEILDVYEMRRDYSEWFVKYRVDFGFFQRYYFTVRKVFGVVRGKRDEDSFLVVGTRELGEIIRYDLVRNTWLGNNLNLDKRDMHSVKSFLRKE